MNSEGHRVRKNQGVSLIAAFGIVAWSVLAPTTASGKGHEGDPEKGKQIFRLCFSCHSLKPGEIRVGAYAELEHGESVRKPHSRLRLLKADAERARQVQRGICRACRLGLLRGRARGEQCKRGQRQAVQAVHGVLLYYMANTPNMVVSIGQETDH